MAYYNCPWSPYVKMRLLEFFFIWVIEFVGFVGDTVISGVQAKWCTYFLWTLGKFHQWVSKWWKQIETPIIWTIANLRDSYSCNHRKRKEQEKSLFMTRWVRLNFSVLNSEDWTTRLKMSLLFCFLRFRFSFLLYFISFLTRINRRKAKQKYRILEDGARKSNMESGFKRNNERRLRVLLGQLYFNNICENNPKEGLQNYFYYQVR